MGFLFTFKKINVFLADGHMPYTYQEVFHSALTFCIEVPGDSHVA